MGAESNTSIGMPLLWKGLGLCSSMVTLMMRTMTVADTLSGGAKTVLHRICVINVISDLNQRRYTMFRGVTRDGAMTNSQSGICQVLMLLRAIVTSARIRRILKSENRFDRSQVDEKGATAK